MSNDIGSLFDAIGRVNLSTRDRSAVLDAVRPFVAAAEARFQEYVSRAAVAELIEVSYKISNWLACAPICTPEDMAQSFGDMSAALDAALTRIRGAA